MLKVGMTIKIEELLKYDELSKKYSNLPIMYNVLFDDEENYYKNIRFRFETNFDSYHFHPCFFLANFSDTCQEIKKENDKTICYTKYLVIDFENAVLNEEIKIIKNEQSSPSEKMIFDMDLYSNEFIKTNQYYEKGFLTKEELINKIFYLNYEFSSQQKKWKKIIKTKYFVGGTANQILKN